jgi:hypothetical protein
MPAYSEEVEELLGIPPSWLVRSGFAVFFGGLTVLLFAESFIRYPEIVQAKVIFSTQTAPISLVARMTGRIKHWFVKPTQTVKAGTVFDRASQKRRAYPFVRSRNSRATWHFVLMEGKEYCISKSFSATEKDDLLKIIAILRKFRHILFTRLID